MPQCRWPAAECEHDPGDDNMTRLGPGIAWFRAVVSLSLIFTTLAGGQTASAPQLLDRVVARVNGTAITLTDVNAAIALGLVEVTRPDDAQAAATRQLVERQLILSEVERFAPPEPEAAAIDREVAAMKARPGPRLEALMQTTGVDEDRIRELARDNLRIQAYLDQRFGTNVQVS